MAVNPVHNAAYPYEDQEFEYEVEQPVRRQPQPPRQPEQPRKPAPRHHSISRGAAMRMLVSIALICAVAIALVYVKAQITGVQRSINELETQIYNANREQSDKLEQLSEAKSVTAIMARAQELGMGYPEQDAITYVQLGDSTSPAASLQGN
ncbi:MAG: hypothetical protein PHD32_03860 [Eubacteriales bacterium]|nr:hypothetical protein [Eubacteriales bacterium]